jgi:hypothetical protein
MPKMSVEQIVRRHAAEFRDKLDRVPVDWAKASLFKRLRLPDIIAKASTGQAVEKTCRRRWR